MRFKLAEDKLEHLRGGVLFALATLVVLLVARYVAPGAGIALAAVGMAWGVERYQRIRHEGTPELADALCTAAPGVVLGAVIELARWAIGI